MMIKRFLSLILSLSLLLCSAFALAEETQAEAPEAAPAEEAAEAAETAETAPVLLATVNGVEVAEDHADYSYWVDYYTYMLSSSGYDLSDESLLQEMKAYSLNNAIRFVLLRQKAAEMGLGEVSEEQLAQVREEAAASWAEILDSYITSYFSITDESSEEDRTAARADALALLESQGYTEESYIEESVSNAKTNQIISDVRSTLVQDVTVSDEEVADYYTQLVEEDRAQYENDVATYEFQTHYYGQDSYYRPEGYRGVTHILLSVDQALLDAWKDLTARLEEQQEAGTAEATEAGESAEASESGESAEAAETEPAESAEPEATEEPVTPEMVEAARQAILDSVQATVEEIRQKLADGASFEDLIVEYGTDPGMQDEKTRSEGYAVHPESILYDTDFVQGAMSMEKVDDISEPIVSKFGVHILHYLRDIPGGSVELTDTLKAELKDVLQNEKEQEAFNSQLEAWVAEAEIVYTEAGQALADVAAGAEEDGSEDEIDVPSSEDAEEAADSAENAEAGGDAAQQP